MISKILKNFNVTVDGCGYAGRINKIILPTLTIQTEEHRAVGMDTPIDIDLDMEKHEDELYFKDSKADQFVYRRGEGTLLYIGEDTKKEKDTYASDMIKIFTARKKSYCRVFKVRRNATAQGRN